MLPPFIIEQIRKREEEKRHREVNQPRLELPLEYGPPPQRKNHTTEEERERGVVIFELK